MNDVRRPTAEDRVILVLACGGITFRAALLQTDNFLQTKIPAARTLAQIATNRTKIPNLRGSNGMRGFSETRKCLKHSRILFQLRERNQRAQAQSAFAVALDLIESAHAFQINHARWPRDVVLHRRQKILSAGDWTRCLVNVCTRLRTKRSDRFLETTWTHPLEGFHALLLSAISPIRILSGVIGSSRTRTPQALKTAFARAPSAGIIAASAMPITTSTLSSSSMIGTSSGI